MAKRNGKNREKFDLNLTIPLLTDEGLRAVNDLTTISVSFPTPDGPRSVPLDRVSPDDIQAEIGRISTIVDASDRMEEIRTLMLAMLDLARRAHLLASWAAEANIALRKVSALIDSLNDGGSIDFARRRTED